MSNFILCMYIIKIIFRVDFWRIGFEISINVYLFEKLIELYWVFVLYRYILEVIV